MDDGLKSVSVLFCCMGNICRSPTAEAVFRHQVNSANRIEGANLAQSFRIDSAETHAYHVGHPPDHRRQAAAAVRGYQMENLRARKVEGLEFVEFDFVLAMDRMNIAELRRIAPDEQTAQTGTADGFQRNPVRHGSARPLLWPVEGLRTCPGNDRRGVCRVTARHKKGAWQDAKLPLTRARCGFRRCRHPMMSSCRFPPAGGVRPRRASAENAAWTFSPDAHSLVQGHVAQILTGFQSSPSQMAN